MQSCAHTVSFDGIRAMPVEVQCAVTAGMPNFGIVGLPDKDVSEARDRIRAALSAMSVALPSKRITVNLAPADLPKIGAHFDLPIALALLAAVEYLPADAIEDLIAMGELSLNGRLAAVPGTLPAAVTAAEQGRGLICSEPSAAEAAWVSATPVYGAPTLDAAIRHLLGQRPLTPASPGTAAPQPPGAGDYRDVKGQDRAKRAAEIAAAGRHHLMMVGPPGSGKSMIAQRLPSILPPLTAAEALETSMILSVAGQLSGGQISRTRPYRAPHHTASKPALVGGGKGARPGEVSLAHNGVLFLDELPEFPRTVLETLRQPIESNSITVSRAAHHTEYPCRFLLVAAANPCRCGHMTDAARACARVPLCGADYLGRISGPLLDRFDLRVEVPAVGILELEMPPPSEGSSDIAARVQAARERQTARFASDFPDSGCLTNSDAEGDVLQQIAPLDGEGQELMRRAADRLRLSARAYHRVLRVARTIADLAGSDDVRRPHLAEAISYRLSDLTAPRPTPPPASGAQRARPQTRSS
ncbi:MAG: AAA family ATPase [Confluentimicrobium sp.]|nr:AAA family ATPase [Actibacterium sp.]